MAAVGSRVLWALACAVGHGLGKLAQTRGSGGLVIGEAEGLQSLGVSQHHRPALCRGLGALGVLRGQEITGVHVPGRAPLQGPRNPLLWRVSGGLWAGGGSVRKVPAPGLLGGGSVKTRLRGGKTGASRGGRCRRSGCWWRAGTPQSYLGLQGPAKPPPPRAALPGGQVWVDPGQPGPRCPVCTDMGEQGHWAPR